MTAGFVIKSDQKQTVKGLISSRFLSCVFLSRSRVSDNMATDRMSTSGATQAVAGPERTAAEDSRWSETHQLLKAAAGLEHTSS